MRVIRPVLAPAYGESLGMRDIRTGPDPAYGQSRSSVQGMGARPRQPCGPKMTSWRWLVGLLPCFAPRTAAAAEGGWWAPATPPEAWRPLTRSSRASLATSVSTAGCATDIEQSRASVYEQRQHQRDHAAQHLGQAHRPHQARHAQVGDGQGAEHGQARCTECDAAEQHRGPPNWREQGEVEIHAVRGCLQPSHGEKLPHAISPHHRRTGRPHRRRWRCCRRSWRPPGCRRSRRRPGRRP